MKIERIHQEVPRPDPALDSDRAIAPEAVETDSEGDSRAQYHRRQKKGGSSPAVTAEEGESAPVPARGDSFFVDLVV